MKLYYWPEFDKDYTPGLAVYYRAMENKDMSKIIRYFVTPHISQFGHVTLRGWDACPVIADENGNEYRGRTRTRFDTKKEAKQFCQEKNDELSGKGERQ